MMLYIIKERGWPRQVGELDVIAIGSALPYVEWYTWNRQQ